MAETSPPRQRSFTVALFKWAGCLVLVVLLIAAVLVGPDQVRPVPEPPDPTGVFATKWKVPASMPATAETPASDETGEPTSVEEQNPPDEALRALLPISDLTQVPEPLRERAAEVNEKMIGFMSDFVALGENAGALTYKDAKKEWMRIQEDRWDLLASWSCETENLEPRVYLEGIAEQDAWDEVAMHAWFALNEAHGEWIDAAVACWGLGGGGPTHDPVWWDREVYYYRKAGLRGRAVLAFRTIMPGLKQMADSVGLEDL